MTNYGDAQYWEDRYKRESNRTFDWLETWSDLKEIIEKHAVNGLYQDGKLIGEDDQQKIKQSTQILNLGCGNSIICENMYDQGYVSITNNDISKVCIETMQKRNEKERPLMKWDVMDVKDMGLYQD